MWHPWHTHTVLEDLVVVLCTAAVTTVMFRRLRQPVLLGYLLAGLLVGPHVSLLPVVADSGRVATISELGVILVMFGIGLEFSLRRLGAVLPTAGVAGAIQIGLMLWLGFLVGQALGWPTMDSVFLGAAVCISSTMVVARVFDEEGIRGQRTELVFGILIVEDLAAVLLLAVLTALASGTTQTGALVAGTVARLLAFLVGLVVLGFLVVPRAIRGVAALRNAETLLVASVGLC
ncbi:MAG TPA: cation:proton antiporter, partial [Planctomycetota bacterium]|nr:cation:proton antiporter [Planctomycetota bacterium]